MKGKAFHILLIVLLLAGLSLLLYPAVSNLYNTWYHSRLITDYTQQVEQLEEYEYREEWEKAERYNAALLERVNQTTIDTDTRNLYYSLLNTTGRNLMGYVEIPAIGVTLPVCHGTEETTLQEAVGHLEWSSLPVGGESTHCVISGHRGLPSSELFTNIDHLEEGDIFYLHVLGRTLEYRVDNIAVVEPHDYTLLQIQEGEDLATLVTCTPYGINSHRLLVRGSRVERSEMPAELLPENEITQVDLMLVIPVMLILLILLVLAIWLVTNKRRNGKRKAGGAREKM